MQRVIVLIFVFMMALTGCTAPGAEDGEISRQDAKVDPAELIPEKLETDNGIPMLKVHVAGTGKIEEMDIETYLMGVVAGEMKNDWPMEALKAQAILARTFTLKFLETKKSAYEGADISTDISEAQAYAPDKINERVKEAVNGTKGIVMVYGDELPQAWFHAHSGGITELPTVALDYDSDPEYLGVVPSYDSDKAPEDVKEWTAVFTKDEIGEACKKAGIAVGACETFELGEKGDSGRAATFIVNGKEISAPTFRINIGAGKLKSTMIKDIDVTGDGVKFTGSGYVHGVGMSQWGAYNLAESGAEAQSIVGHYYQGVDFVGLW